MPHISHHIRNTTIIHPLEKIPGASAERADRAQGNFEKKKPNTETPMHRCPLRRGLKNSQKNKPREKKEKKANGGRKPREDTSASPQQPSKTCLSQEYKIKTAVFCFCFFCSVIRCSQRGSTWCCAAWHSPGPHPISDRHMSRNSHRGTAR